MNTAPLAAALTCLRRAAASGAAGDPSDLQLLEAYVAANDQAAFTALVRRHGPMVLGLCRRVLQNAHDAEDAFQAVFLTLARKAASLRNGEALSCWLHGVSYRIALRAKRSTARRRQHESRVAPRSNPPPWEVGWRELQTVLDQEVEQLAPTYRSPFVLCCLEGLSRAEAAGHLGLKENTVSSRLARARKQLQERLLRRGISLTAVLAALAVSGAGRAAPPLRLVRTTATAASQLGAGTPVPGLSARALSLAEGVTTTMLTSTGKLAIVVLLALAALGTGLGLFARSAPLAPPSPRGQAAARESAPRAAAKPKSKPPAAKEQDNKSLSYAGRVLDPDGKPFANARLYWPRLLKREPRTRADIAIVQVGRSDAKGRFSVQLQRIDTPSGRPMSLVAAADGYGLGWANVRTDTPPSELTLRLVKDQPIRGRVLSTEGKPVAGATVAINGLFSGPQGKLDPFLIAWKQEYQLAFQKTDRRLYSPLEKVIAIAPSDKDGRFEVRGLGVERLVQLQVSAPGFAQESLYVVNRADFDVEPYNKAAQERFPRMAPVLAGPTFRIVAEKARVIEGVVKEAPNGKPLAGVSLFSIAGYNNSVYAVSDAKGHYRISGLPKSKDYRIHATPPGKSALMTRTVRIVDDGGLGTIKFDIEMMRGVVLTGRVIDRATGKGVRGGIRFAPLPDNKFFGKPGYDSYRYEKLMHGVKADGSYRLVVIPGSGVLMFQAYGTEKELGGLPVKPWMRATLTAAERKRVPLGEDGRFTAAGNALEFLSNDIAAKVLDLAADAGTVKCDLFVERGKTLTVRVQDAEGKPLPGATIGGMTASWPSVFPLKEASCTVYALDPKRPRTLLFYHAGRKLAGKLTVRGDAKEPPAVRLSAVGSVRGRLVDVDGQPLAGIAVRPSYRGDVAQELERQLNQGREVIRTDKEGRFHLEGVIPDLKFGLSLTKGRTYFRGEPRIGQRQVASGKELDLGTLRLRPGN